LQAKRKISEKLEQLNQAREQIETIQRERDEMKEQENSSLWQKSPHQNSGPTKRAPKENFFAGSGISQFVDSESPLFHRAANCTMATKVQTGLSPEV
jgi:hypothetical protein